MSTNSELHLGLVKERLKLLEDVARLEASNTIFANDPSMVILANEKQIKSIDEEIARLSSGETVESEAVPDVKPIKWQGNKVEFASAIIDLYAKGHILAKSQADALKQAALHFVDKDGKVFKPKSLWQNFQNKSEQNKILKKT